MDNPFLKYARPTAKPENPFLKYAQAPAQEPVVAEENPLPLTPPSKKVETFDSTVNANQAMYDQDALNTMRESGVFEASPTGGAQDGLQSNSELYSEIDADPKYQPVNDFENQLSYKAGHVRLPDHNIPYVPSGEWSFAGKTPEAVENLRRDKTEAKLEKYVDSGTKSNSWLAEGVEMLGGFPVMEQERRVPNPNYDKLRPPSEDNPLEVTNRYILDPPDATALERMGYQILSNVGGGTVDLTEGKLTGKGSFTNSLPGAGETVPDKTGEGFATGLSSILLGGIGAEKAIGGISSLVSKTARTISPEARQAVRTAYQETLAATGDAKLAKMSADAASKNVLAGLVGVRGEATLNRAKTIGSMATKGVVEAAVAPTDSTGTAVSSEYLQKTFGMSRERADDMSFLLDTPVLSGGLAAMGGVKKLLVDKLAVPALGGLREMTIAGTNLKTAKALDYKDKEAGISFLAWLDPNMVNNVSPEEAAGRMSMLMNVINRNGEKNLKLMGAEKTTKLDTTTALDLGLEDYYRSAYAPMKFRMDRESPGSFDKWVEQQSFDSSQKLYKLRATLGAEKTSSVAIEDLRGLLGEASESVNPQGLGFANEKAAQVMGKENIAQRTGLNEDVRQAGLDADQAKFNAENAMLNDPEFGGYVRSQNDTLGAPETQQKIVEGQITPKLLRSQGKMKADVDEAYKKVGAIDADGDPVSLLEIIHQTGVKNDKGGVDLNDNLFKNLAEQIESDPSVGNLYNNVRNQVNKEIGAIKRANIDPQGRLQTLEELRDNLNNHQLDFVAQQGDENIKTLVNDAKTKYIDYQNNFYGDTTSEFQNVSRTGEKVIGSRNAPITKGAGDYRKSVSQFINNNLSTNEGKIFRDEIEAAAIGGGETISKDLGDYYLSKAINKISDNIAKGGKQNVATLRNSLRDVVLHMKDSNHPNLKMFTDMEDTIKQLEQTGVDKATAFEKIKTQAAEMEKNAKDSILARFVSSEGGKLAPVAGEDMQKKLYQIFSGGEAVTNIRNLVKHADTLPEGKVIREALEGNYAQYLANKMKGGAKMDSVPPEGHIARRPNDRKIDEIFNDEIGNDMKVAREIFKDKPETIQAFDDIGQLLEKLGRKVSTTGEKNPLGKVPKSQNPQVGTSNAITILFGQLNPRATKIRRFTTPLTVDNLDEVVARRNDFFQKLAEDPARVEQMLKDVKTSTLKDEDKSWFKRSVTRAIGREALSDRDMELIPTLDETEKLLNGAIETGRKFIP